MADAQKVQMLYQRAFNTLPGKKEVLQGPGTPQPENRRKR
jgi:hypothetical protein